MDESQFINSPAGRLVDQISMQTGEAYKAFLPSPLPRSLGALGLDDISLTQIAGAEQALGRLDGTLATLPRLPIDNTLLMAQIIYRKEAVASTRIEGTRITEDEAQRFEATGPDQDSEVAYREVTNYIEALKAGQELIGELPISSRFLRTLHGILLEGIPKDRARGAHGEFRTHPVIIGGTDRIADARFIPPPPEDVPALMQDWADFANGETRMPITVRAALLHYQFETIHPFGDGNGRLGRLMVKLYFYGQKALRHPFLYLSGYLLRNRGAYYDAMLGVSQRGAWNDWITFFTRGIQEQADETTRLAVAIVSLYDSYMAKLDTLGTPETATKLIDLIFERQTITAKLVSERLDVSENYARSLIGRFVDAGLLTERTGKQRYKEYVPEAIARLAG